LVVILSSGSVATIFTHGDADGVSAAALALAALRLYYGSVNVFFSNPVGLVNDFIRDAEGDVYIIDIAISEAHAEEFAEVVRGYEGRVTLIDHHPLPMVIDVNRLNVKLIHSLECSASELTFKYFRDALDPDYDRVALYGAIGDYLDHTPWVVKRLERWDKRQIYFEAGILALGLEGSRGMYDFKRSVVEHLSRNWRPSQLSELTIRALTQASSLEKLHEWVRDHVLTKDNVAYVINPPGSLGIAAAYAMGVTSKPLGVAARERDGEYVISLRAERGVINLDRVLRGVVKELGGSLGGHPWAAGGRLPKGRFEELLNYLNNLLKREG